MLQISYIRQNREDVITRLKVKNFSELNVVDDVISTDDELRRIKQETESTQSKIKKLSDEMVSRYDEHKPVLYEQNLCP